MSVNYVALGKRIGYFRMQCGNITQEALASKINRSREFLGKIEKGTKVVVIEDLISTGGSVIEVVDVLREAGAEVLGIASIFTYGLQKGIDRLAAANVKNVSLSNADVLVKVAADEGYIKENDIKKLNAFFADTSDPSWMTL